MPRIPSALCVGSVSAFACGLGLVTTAARAQQQQPIPGVTVESVSSELIQNFSRDADRVVDGSGLNVNGPGTHTTTPDGFMWLNVGTTNCCGGVSYVDPQGNTDNTPTITFDLGQVYELDFARVWNYNEAGNLRLRGVQTGYISLSDGTDYRATTLGPRDFAVAPGVDDVDFHEDHFIFALPDSTRNARYVEFQFLTNHGGDNGFFGLSEVQFFAVPEPAAVGLIAVAGCAAFGGRRRHRR